MDNSKHKKVVITMLHKFHFHPEVPVLYKVTFLDKDDRPDISIIMKVSEPDMKFLISIWEEQVSLQVILNEKSN